jgi:hypothetical protein
MMDSHLNHLGRKTSERVWILQDHLSMLTGTVLSITQPSVICSQEGIDRPWEFVWTDVRELASGLTSPVRDLNRLWQITKAQHGNDTQQRPRRQNNKRVSPADHVDETRDQLN